MFISNNEYYNLLDCKEMNSELEKEIKRLELMLNTRERTCKVGAWCKNCGHWVTDKSKITSSFSEGIAGAKTTKTMVLEEQNLEEFNRLTAIEEEENQLSKYKQSLEIAKEDAQKAIENRCVYRNKDAVQ